MSAVAIMLQGTGSDVGKSVLVAGLCRIAKRRGIRVAPFKPQNMSNNAAACPQGGEIGRAQALQAHAAGLQPHPDFNPVLLKPQTDRTSQIVVHGRAIETSGAASYIARRDKLMPAVLESFDRLCEQYDLIVVEGAGSPAEINLRKRDIANMGFSHAAGVPVCLVGDIDRGGVIASVVGTKVVIAPSDAAQITGFAINKFRGDPTLFEDGVTAISERTGWPCFGVIPWLAATRNLPAEDAVALSVTDKATDNSGKLKIVAPMLSRMANFDDADPLKLEPDVDFSFVSAGQPIPRDADVIVLFGTKSTLGDLAFVRQQGWDHDIISHVRHGGHVLGICGGFQMLGQQLRDRDGVDGPAGEVDGLGLLDVNIDMTVEKTVRPVSGKSVAHGVRVDGYEIHVGQPTGGALERPMLTLDGHAEGARSLDGLVEGTHVHGLFSSNSFRSAWLETIRTGASSRVDYGATVDAALDELADGLETALDVDALFAAARAPGWKPELS